MIGNCFVSGKYNMTAWWYLKSSTANINTGQIKATYSNPHKINCVARGLSNLRGKDSGTMQDYGNKINEYHYLRVKTMEKLNDGDILTQIFGADGKIYLDGSIQFTVLGVTPTFDPFGMFMEYDILANKSEVHVNLPDIIMSSSDTMPVGGG